MLHPSLGHEAMNALDPPLGILMPFAEINLTCLARWAAARAANGCGDKVAGFELRHVRTGFLDDCEGFMSNHQFLLPSRGGAELSLHDLPVGAANARQHGFHQHFISTDWLEWDPRQMS